MLSGKFYSLKIIHLKPSCLNCLIPLKSYCKKSSSRNLYDVLEIKNTSSAKDVKKAYIKLCKELHPDMKPGDTAQHKKFVELSNAYSVLSNKDSRRRYDDSVSGRAVNNDSQKGAYYRRSSKSSSNPFNDPSPEYAWYDRDIYQQERDYFKRQRQNARVSRQANQTWILGGCLLLVVFGYLMYYACYSYSLSTLKKVDKKSKKIKEVYDAIVEDTIEEGKEKAKEKTIQRWKTRLNQPD